MNQGRGIGLARSKTDVMKNFSKISFYEVFSSNLNMK